MGRGVAHAVSGWLRRVWAAGLCGSCGQRRLGFGTALASDAGREEGDDAQLGLVWLCAGRTSASSRSCATMQPFGGEALGATGPLGSVDGEGRCACVVGMVQACVGRGALRVLGAAPPRRRHGAGGAMRGARREMMGGLVWLCADRTSASCRSCATMRPSGGVGSDGAIRQCGWGGALRMRLRGVQVVRAAGLCGSCGQRRLGFGTAPAGRCGARGWR
jgi:hypothetical protein